MKKFIGALLGVIAIVAMIEVYFGSLQHRVADNVKINGIFLAKPKTINNFHLEATTGEVFSKANLTGHWTMMFFGFTHCAMVCPATMSELNNMFKILGKDLPQEKMPQVVMVSVDPDRDSVLRMRQFVNSFNANFVGARADNSETTKLEKQLHIKAEKIQVVGQDKNDYSINHSAEILLFNPQGRLQAYLSYPHNAVQMAKDYQLILKTVG